MQWDNDILLQYALNPGPKSKIFGATRYFETIYSCDFPLILLCLYRNCMHTLIRPPGIGHNVGLIQYCRYLVTVYGAFNEVAVMGKG